VLNRLALVIHWLGFVSGFALMVASVATLDLTTESREETRNHACREYTNPVLTDDEKVAANAGDLSNISIEGLCYLLGEGPFYETRIKPNFLNWLFILMLTIAPLLIGWAVRFVLTRDNVILPWLRPKESSLSRQTSRVFITIENTGWTILFFSLIVCAEWGAQWMGLEFSGVELLWGSLWVCVVGWIIIKSIFRSVYFNRFRGWVNETDWYVVAGISIVYFAVFAFFLGLIPFLIITFAQ
jgi:hypothetical protein